LPTRRAVAKQDGLPPLPDTSQEAPALAALANKTLEAVKLRNAGKLIKLFSPTVYADYGLDTFAEEFGPEAVRSQAEIASLYARLLKDPKGRARWLYLSEEAGPATQGERTPYRIFTERIPAHEVTNVFICFARGKAPRAVWPNSIVALQTARTSDPYACLFAVKKQGRWWLDFERNYMAAGRVPPVP
jgi:hypothetical protein